ncbi:hypothetical protein ACFJGW_11020 [Burkholderiaceae bacterium UC74_6]
MTNRLQDEARRLFPPPLPDGRVRALCIELASPADWRAFGALWRGVQAELELPAPGIAINGCHGYQLWFSMAAPVAATEAEAFAEALRRRWLAEALPQRVRVLTANLDGILPPQQVAVEQWAAFVAPDLAPVFEDTPWLDVEPSAEGQADLLSRQQPILLGAWQEAMRRLGAAPVPAQAVRPAVPTAPLVSNESDPRAFLLRVMNDPQVEMTLRIEAAKALLAN